MECGAAEVPKNPNCMAFIFERVSQMVSSCGDYPRALASSREARLRCFGVLEADLSSIEEL